MSAFVFNYRADLKAVHQAELPAGIKSEDALLDNLSVVLRFPAYFGRNWNALDECIRDLSWLPPGDVVLSHKDLPLSEDHTSLLIYLSILHDAIDSWKTKGSNLIFASPEGNDASGERKALVNRRFYVLFPPSTRETVETLLAKARSPRGSFGDKQS